MPNICEGVLPKYLTPIRCYTVLPPTRDLRHILGVDAPAPLPDDLFRQASRRLIPRLTRLFGAERLALAEDAAQEAFIAALQTWPRTGIPADPSAWLLQVARRKALDALRRETTAEAHAERLHDSSLADDVAAQQMAEFDAAVDAHEIADDTLRMLFLCAHPALSAESRVALMLKTVGGFGVPEIARLLLAEETAVAQRLVRAKRTLRDLRVRFDWPSAQELESRRASVLDAIYAMFTEAHVAHAGDELLRDDLARDALRLAELLALHPVVGSADAHALAALIALQLARFPARIDAEGALVLLPDQDRSRWDQALIARGFQHLERAASGTRRSAYHLEAEIAAVHAAAPAWRDTDWTRVVQSYDALIALTASPVAALNRCVAVKERDGAAQALTALEQFVTDPALAAYPMLEIVRGDLLEATGRRREAVAAFTRAHEQLASSALRQHLSRRLRSLDVDFAPPSPS